MGDNTVVKIGISFLILGIVSFFAFLFLALSIQPNAGWSFPVILLCLLGFGYPVLGAIGLTIIETVWPVW